MKTPALIRIRRNHAIEHAAMHMLGVRGCSSALVARSDSRGMTFYGDVDSAMLEESILNGIKALHAGQGSLAIHPRCGSMVSVSVLLGFISAWASRSGLRKVPAPLRALGMLGAVGSALTLARPLGEAAQFHLLTDAQPKGAHLVRMTRSRVGNLIIHRAIIAHQ